MALRDGKRDHILPLGQPVLPGEAGCRLPDIEEEAPVPHHALCQFMVGRRIVHIAQKVCSGFEITAWTNNSLNPVA
ncbi:hypothetical protein MesoLj113a_41910 [Mesorhizobium sp. 113-1-2]|nr:Quinic acid utilization activator [Mesorhizobium loti]BCG73033.1 hypothetical protein MesoLj113a_41910 [Mesorhizobium sp. 113-1-2]